MRIIQLSSTRMMNREHLLEQRFVLERTGTFEAAHKFLRLIREPGAYVTSRNWFPNVLEYLTTHFLWIRMRPFMGNTEDETRMPLMLKNEFFGLLQYIQEVDSDMSRRFVVRPTGQSWKCDGPIPKWVDFGRRRPPKQQKTSLPITQEDANVLAMFFWDKPKAKPYPWVKWFASPASMQRIASIVTYAGDAFEEQVVLDDMVVPVGHLCNLQQNEKGETWSTRVQLNTARGKIILPVTNFIPVVKERDSVIQRKDEADLRGRSLHGTDPGGDRPEYPGGGKGGSDHGAEGLVPGHSAHEHGGI